MKTLELKRMLAAAIILGLGLVITYWMKKASPNKDDAKLYQVRQIYSTLPIPQGFKEIDSSFQSKAELALLTKYFRASVPFDDVREFYIQRLSPTGWTLVKERPVTDWFRDLGGRELTFRKAENSLVIDYAGERANDQWDYAIGLEWKSNR